MNEEKTQEDSVENSIIKKAKFEIKALTERAKQRNEAWYHEAVHQIKWGELVNYTLKIDNAEFIKPYESSEWLCYLFGNRGNGMVWRPEKGKEPKWFWRKMQYLCFGNKWVKDEAD